MVYQPKNLYLRRFEVQVHYDAAYLYWNLRGVIAEKWGHGPLFGGYGEMADRTTLSLGVGENADVVGVYGLKFIAWNWERMADIDEGKELALEWVHDCLQVLTPQVVKRVFVRLQYAYPVGATRTKVEKQMRNEFEGLDLFNPAGYAEIVHGAQFQAHKESDGVKVVASGIFGLYSPEQAEELFNSKQDVDTDWCLGLFYDRNEMCDDGFNDPLATLIAAIDTAFKETKEVIDDRLIGVVGNA